MQQGAAQRARIHSNSTHSLEKTREFRKADPLSLTHTMHIFLDQSASVTRMLTAHVRVFALFVPSLVLFSLSPCPLADTKAGTHTHIM